MKEIISSDYSIWIGQDALTKLNLSSYTRVAILVDENTKRDCLNKLPIIENSIVIEIKSGEENKNIRTCTFIWKELTKHQVDKDSLLINLGGGVIGDMGGFCASSYKRGIDFIHIPTTLLAMVDASVGGKLGVDFTGLKNQIGIFNNPKSVLIYPEFLETLCWTELKSGFAEVVKHALIADKKLWHKITTTPLNFEKGYGNITSTEKLIWREIITTSVKIKNNIVLADPLDKGERKKLNFGHTFGHAIESYYLGKSNPILHGEAVFIGMVLETELSSLSIDRKVEIKNFILSTIFPTLNLMAYVPKRSDLLPFLRNDKKNKNEKINFSLLTEIGECSVDNLFSDNEL